MVRLNCCGIFYYSNGDKFEKISRYVTEPKNHIKNYVNGAKVLSETIYVAVCYNCGHYIVTVLRHVNGFKLDKEFYHGKAADEYFYSHYDKFIEKPLPYPYADVKHAKTIPFIYGKTTGAETQMPRYIDESGNAGNFIESLIRTFKNT